MIRLLSGFPGFEENGSMCQLLHFKLDEYRSFDNTEIGKGPAFRRNFAAL